MDSNFDYPNLTFDRYVHKTDIENLTTEFNELSSDYVDCLTVKNELKGKNNDHFITLHLNIQGLKSKFDNLKLFLCDLEEQHIYFDAILLCETF